MMNELLFDYAVFIVYSALIVHSAYEMVWQWVTADCDLDLQLEPQLESNHQAAIMNCVSQKKGTPSVTILSQDYNIVNMI